MKKEQSYVKPIVIEMSLEFDGFLCLSPIELNVTVDEATNVIFDGDEEYIDITF